MNNDKILEKLRMKIAISNSIEEDINMKKNKMNLGKSIGIAACILVSTTGVAFATNYLINKFGNNSSDGVQTAVENQYVSENNTEYKESSGISVSVDSFLIDDANFDMTFDIKFSEQYKIEDIMKMDIMDLKVVNEKGKKVFATHELESEEMQSLYKTEQEAKENYDSYCGSYGGNCEKISNNEIKYYLTAAGNPVDLPESQKLSVTFNKIRICDWVGNEEKFVIYKGEWSYDIDVPTKMSKSNIVNYKLKSFSDKNYQFVEAKLSNTAFKIYLNNCDGIAWNNNSCVENSNGEKFYSAQRSDGDGAISHDNNGKVTYYNTFNLTNYDGTDTLKVHLYKANGEEVIVELVKE